MEVWTRLRAGLCATASAAAAFTLMLGPAHALDQFQVVAPGAEKDMVTALENASLVKQAQDSEITDPVRMRRVRFWLASCARMRASSLAQAEM